LKKDEAKIWDMLHKPSYFTYNKTVYVTQIIIFLKLTLIKMDEGSTIFIRE
jgi:hypothetical protein